MKINFTGKMFLTKFCLFHSELKKKSLNTTYENFFKEEPMEQNMEDLIPETMESMEQKEVMENINRPRTTTPTNIMVIKDTYCYAYCITTSVSVTVVYI